MSITHLEVSPGLFILINSSWYLSMSSLNPSSYHRVIFSRCKSFKQGFGTACREVICYIVTKACHVFPHMICIINYIFDQLKNVIDSTCITQASHSIDNKLNSNLIRIWLITVTPMVWKQPGHPVYKCHDHVLQLTVLISHPYWLQVSNNLDYWQKESSHEGYEQSYLAIYTRILLLSHYYFFLFSYAWESLALQD